MDRVLAVWGRQNRYAGSGDRRAIADLLYDALRRLRSAAWAAGVEREPTGRQVLHGLLLLQGMDPSDMFNGLGHAPAVLTSEECAARRDLEGAPRAVRLDYPDWLEEDLAAVPDADLAVLQTRAPLDLRANLLMTDRDAVCDALAAEGIETEPGPLSATALRVLSGDRKLQNSSAWREGLVEVQDAASQAVADFAAARAGETVLDLCAGGGGKALALAARMAGNGRVTAHDIDPRRMWDLPSRAGRAGAEIEEVSTNVLAASDRRFSMVLVDAPCSGSGTWRRNPDAKWRLLPRRMAALTAIQSELLDQAASLVAPGGHMIYATCSILDRENGRQIDTWLDRNPGWAVTDRLSLGLDAGGDGMFAAAITSV